MLIEKVNRTIENHRMLGDGKVIVAVSGGVDSVVLLDILRRIVPSNRLVIGHLDHGIRGEAARADAEFVVELGRKLGIPVIRGEADVPGLSRRAGLSLEEAGRKARREFLEETARVQGADRIALGHTRDDLVETVLFNLARGAGPTGLVGIRPVSLPYVRPLIEVTREEVLGYARSAGLSWREDETNADVRFSRNLIRHRVIPLLEELNPRAREAIARAAALIAAEGAALELLLNPVWEEVLVENGDTTVTLDRGRLATLDPAVQGLVLRRALNCVRGSLTRIEKGHIDSLTRLASSPRAHAALYLPGCHARLDRNTIVISTGSEHGQEFAPLRLELGRNEIPELGIAITLELRDWQGQPPPDDPAVEAADAAAVEFPLELRTRRPGDRFAPLGMKEMKKLKELLIDAKVPFYARDRLPIVCDRAGIIWVVGVRLAERVKLTPGTKRALIMHAEEI